ncbi:MAG: DUF1553 domain-containing protein [Gemmataceae bacterium]
MKRSMLILAGFLLVTPSLRAEEPVSFSRHVMGVFSRLNCNGGTCHGAVQGQNGFRLSLFGANPELDYARLVREYSGRRLNPANPEQSLLLLKATAAVGHEGGKRMAVGSHEYDILRKWIASGAPIDPLETGRTTSLRVLPAEKTLKPGESYQLKVEAKFADGSVEDVTPLCSYETLDNIVATVNQAGKVTAHGAGDAALIVRYRAEPMMAIAVVPRPGSEAFPDVKPNNFVDKHVLAKLKRLNIPPAAVCDDATFLRRAALDITGTLPTPKEVREFLADKSADKRARKVDELLSRPGYAAVWTLKFCDLLKATDYGVYADGISEHEDAPRFQAWIRARLEENMAYDEMVARILTATSRDGRSLEEWSKDVQAIDAGYKNERTDTKLYAQRKTPDLYWQRKGAKGVSGALQVAHAFLGLRLECAQCHRHPHDVWQQDDLLAFSNFFMGVRQTGFQGGNEKKFPEVAKFVKTFNDEAKKLTEEVKKQKEELKKLEAEAKKDPKAKQAEVDKLKAEIGDKERRAKSLPEIGKRLLHAEVHHVADHKSFASVTSPLGTQESKEFRLLGLPDEIKVTAEEDPRVKVVEWLRRADNPFFARAIVNRVWAHYFGRGIIDPPDHLSSFNPATHPELLDELCKGFIASKYDLKWLHRAIVNSRTYQQSSKASAANALDRTNYAYFYYRRLPAEVLIDALNQATGTSEDMGMQYYNWKKDMRAVEVPYTPKNGFVSFMLEQFGRPKRNSAVQCDCERDSNASVLQILSFANHPRLWQKIQDDKGEAARILKEIKDDNARVEEVFLVALSRLPADEEKATCLKYLKDAESPEKGLEGILWSLINTKEFLLQH